MHFRKKVTLNLIQTDALWQRVCQGVLSNWSDHKLELCLVDRVTRATFLYARIAFHWFLLVLVRDAVSTWPSLGLFGSCHLCLHLGCLGYFLLQLKTRRRSRRHMHTVFCNVLFVKYCWHPTDFVILAITLTALNQTWGRMQQGCGFCFQLLHIQKADVFGSAGVLASLPQRLRERHLKDQGFLYTKLYKWGRMLFWTA